MTLEQTISAIRPLDEKSMTAARNRFANIAMPLGGLGLLQDAIVQLAGILGQLVPDISRRAAVVFCADNGVVAEGVTRAGGDSHGRGKYGPRRVHRVFDGKTARNGRVSGRYRCCTADKERKSAAICRSARNCKLCA